MNWASVATLFVFFGYTAISWGVLGPLDSISQSWYKWHDQNFSAAFNIFGFLACMCCICQQFYVENLFTTPFFVLSGACMWLLTVASPYKDYSPHHVIPTLCAIVLGFAANFIEFGWSPRFWHPLWIFGVLAATIKVFQVPYSTTWAELLAVTCILFNFIFTNQ